MKRILYLVLYCALAATLTGCVGGGLGVSPLPYNASGEVVDTAGNGVLGVTILFSDGYGTAATGPDGKWTKSFLQGTVAVTPQKEGWAFTPSQNTVSPVSSSKTFVATLVGGNHPPQLDFIGDKDVVEGEALSFMVTATDEDDDVLTISASKLPSGARFDEVNGEFTWTPAKGQSGSYTIAFTASDGGYADTVSIVITVAAAVEAPVVSDHEVVIDEDSSTTIDVLSGISGSEGDDITIVDVTQPSNGEASITPDQQIEYTPDEDFHGDDSFTYTVSNGEGGTATGTVNVTISPVNDSPVALDDYFLVSASPQGSTISYLMGLLSNDFDQDGDTLEVVSVAQPEHGQVLQFWPEGDVEYSPDVGFEGMDSFVYTVSDGNGRFAAAVVNVQVYISE